MLTATLRRAAPGFALLTVALAAPRAHAQGKTFEVVSIRQNISRSGTNPG